MRMIECNRVHRRRERGAHFKFCRIGQQSTRHDDWRSAPFLLMIMRELAHMTSEGLLPRMPQQRSVISGTSTRSSISGNITRRRGVEGVDRKLQIVKQCSITGAHTGFGLDPSGASRDGNIEFVPRKPLKTVNCRLPGIYSPNALVLGRKIMIKRNAQGELAWKPAI